MKRYKNRNIGDIIEYTSNSEYGIPVANMDKVAIKTGLSHQAINKSIYNHKNILKQSGPVRNRIQPGSSHKKTYFLDSPQCAYIIEKMHTRGADELKQQIANVFAYQIRKQLERQAVHQLSKDAVKSYCDAIQYYLDDPAGYMYGHITNLAYKLALGVGVKKIQELRGANSKSNKKDYLSSREIELLSKAMNKIETLLELGMTYDKIKNFVSNHCLNKAKVTVKLDDTVHE